MTTETTSRYGAGGFEDRFRVTRTDGKSIRDTARYLVLNYAEDPHAKKAIEAYADSIESENPSMAADMRACIANPTAFPAQHD
jgi:hypothetical protein